MTTDQAMQCAATKRTVPERDRYNDEHAILALAEEVENLRGHIARLEELAKHGRRENETLRAELADARDEIAALTIERDSLQAHALTTEQGAAVVAMADEVDRLRGSLRVIRDYYSGAGYIGGIAADALGMEASR